MGSYPPVGHDMGVEKIGVIGVGVMGSMISLLLADAGVKVSIHDRSAEMLQRTSQKAIEEGLGHKINVCKDYDSLCQSLGPRKVFIFSLPHGGPGDAVVKTLEPYLKKGDIVIDGSNEHYLVTQKRQAILHSRGVAFVGMGISGGFRGARYGPSLMPSGDDWAVDLLLPLLEKIAAKDDHSRPCVTKIGPGGSGHYVKMIHNGIEHGVMSVLCEAWELMAKCLEMDGDAIGSVFDSWNSSGELRQNFLVGISGPICRTKIENNKSYLLHQIRDAVVQDANDSEGTGVWANLEAVSAHVPAPSLTAAHYMRIASASVSQRQSVREATGTTIPSAIPLEMSQKPVFLEDLRKAVYVSVLACFIQGMDLLSRTSKAQGWDINLQDVVRIWRAGCIIKSDYITDLLELHYASNPDEYLLCGKLIPSEIKRCWPSLKHVVLKGLAADAHLPCLGATLEYLKYSSSTELPTNFMEAQMDAFGAHGFEYKDDKVGGISKGKHHNSWSMS